MIKSQNALHQFCGGLWTLNRYEKRQICKKVLLTIITRLAYVTSIQFGLEKLWRFLFDASKPFPRLDIVAVGWFTVRIYLQPQLDATIPGTSLRTIVLSSS